MIYAPVTQCIVFVCLEPSPFSCNPDEAAYVRADQEVQLSFAVDIKKQARLSRARTQNPGFYECVCIYDCLQIYYLFGLLCIGICASDFLVSILFGSPVYLAGGLTQYRRQHGRRQANRRASVHASCGDELTVTQVHLAIFVGMQLEASSCVGCLALECASLCAFVG